MKKVKLEDGFEMQLDDHVLDNMELIDTLAEMKNDDDLVAISRLLKLMLGETGRKKLYDHIREKDGRVPIVAASKAVWEIFKSYKDEGKNR